MVDGSLQNRVCLVTGASRGIGVAIARAAAVAGAAVAVNYRSSQRQAELLVEELRDLGHQAIAVQADVGSSYDVAKMYTTIERELGPVSLLVNNAGVSLRIGYSH